MLKGKVKVLDGIVEGLEQKKLLVKAGKDDQPKPKGDPKNDPKDMSLSLDQYIDGFWMPYQDKLAFEYKACKDDPQTPYTETVQTDEVVTGEECNVDAAIDELMSVDERGMGPDQTPAVQENGTDVIKEKLRKAYQTPPPCNGHPTIGVDQCDQANNKWAKENGFGSLDEMCMVSGGMGDMCVARKTKQMAEDAQKKANEPFDHKQNLGAEKPTFMDLLKPTPLDQFCRNQPDHVECKEWKKTLIGGKIFIKKAS